MTKLKNIMVKLIVNTIAIAFRLLFPTWFVLSLMEQTMYGYFMAMVALPLSIIVGVFMIEVYSNKPQVNKPIVRYMLAFTFALLYLDILFALISGVVIAFQKGVLTGVFISVFLVPMIAIILFGAASYIKSKIK